MPEREGGRPSHWVMCLCVCSGAKKCVRKVSWSERELSPHYFVGVDKQLGMVVHVLAPNGSNKQRVVQNLTTPHNMEKKEVKEVMS